MQADRDHQCRQLQIGMHQHQYHRYQHQRGDQHRDEHRHQQTHHQLSNIVGTMPNKPTRAQLKRRHERAVADTVIRIVGGPGVFLRMGNDHGEPDVIFEIAGRTLGIEVATVHHDDSDARQEWTLAAGERAFSTLGYEDRDGGSLLNGDALICRRVQNQIQVKFGKKYAGTETTWLCIQVRDPLVDRRSLTECAELCHRLTAHLRRLHGEPFQAVYLLWPGTNLTGPNVVAQVYPGLEIAWPESRT